MSFWLLCLLAASTVVRNAVSQNAWLWLMSNGSFHFYSMAIFTRTNASLLSKVHFKTRPGNGYVMHVLEFISVYLYFKFPHTHRIKQKTFWWKCAYSFYFFHPIFGSSSSCYRLRQTKRMNFGACRMTRSRNFVCI